LISSFNLLISFFSSSSVDWSQKNQLSSLYVQIHFLSFKLFQSLIFHLIKEVVLEIEFTNQEVNVQEKLSTAFSTFLSKNIKMAFIKYHVNTTDNNTNINANIFL